MKFWRFSRKILLKALLVTLPIVYCCGCVNGPVRYKTVGFRKSVTREACRCAYYPVLLPAGIVADAGIVAADTVVVPASVLWSVLKYPMGEDETSDTILGYLVMPIYGPIYVLENSIMLPYANRQDYGEIYGLESGWMKSGEIE